jgi:hypothetical protein
MKAESFKGCREGRLTWFGRRAYILVAKKALPSTLSRATRRGCFLSAGGGSKRSDPHLRRAVIFWRQAAHEALQSSRADPTSTAHKRAWQFPLSDRAHDGPPAEAGCDRTLFNGQSDPLRPWIVKAHLYLRLVNSDCHSNWSGMIALRARLLGSKVTLYSPQLLYPPDPGIFSS